ncbi:MAG TPA: alpha/beta hydrolase [Gammaproteobacteria bacterium]|nr:alpha/beta hydrolase [Gammaproteobacteria bacterium]
MTQGRRVLVVLALALLSGACTTPMVRNDAFAVASGFTRQVVPGADFSHLVYIAENNAKTRKKNVWHVYIEGDGIPWVRRQIITADPTPSEPLMLQLMAQDSHPAIYLGRPCYYGMARDSACNPWVWTYGRYSEQVVESMRVALAALINANTISSLVLIGHSGGGTLAMLLAERVPQTRLVVTLAGNLDTDAWTARHGYTPLEYSLNPAHRPPLPRHIDQLHYVGKNDKNVPPEMLKAALQQQNARMFVLDDLQHQQGWNNYWTKILQKIDFSGRGYE